MGTAAQRARERGNGGEANSGEEQQQRAEQDVDLVIDGEGGEGGDTF